MPEPATAEPTSTAMTFEKAYADAKAEHSTQEPEQPADQKPVEPPDGDTAPEPKTPEDSEPAAEPADSSAESLLSKKELSEISKLSPADQYKAMQRAYTQKTQKLASERKMIETYQRLIDSLQNDPLGTIKLLAEHQGLVIQEKAAAAPAKPAEQSEPTSAELRSKIDPEVLPVFEPILKVIERLEQRLAKAEGEFTPLKQRQEEQIAQVAETEAAKVVKDFGEKHKGWEKHEPKMLEISQRLLPNGMDEPEYLETLYTLATAGVSESESVQKAIEKMQKAAAASELSSSGVSTSKVAPVAPKGVSNTDLFARAYEAAKAGVVWEE